MSDTPSDDDYTEERPHRRPHRATGNKPPGGKREGAGRPEGTTNALRYGEVRALRGLRYRVPEGTPEAFGDVADIAFERIVDVMMERVDPKQGAQVLKSATHIREEICGPVAQRLEHTGANGESLVVEVRKYPKGDAE